MTITKQDFRVALIYQDTTGTTTTSASETNLFVDAAGNNYVTNGFINLGRYAGSPCMIAFHESAGYAGTLKVYGALTAATTYQFQIGANQTITASTGSHVVLSAAPQFLRVTITRSTSNITVRYAVIVPKLGGLG